MRGEWQRVAVSEIAKLVLGGTPAKAKPEYWEGGTIPWATAKDIVSANGRFVYRTENSITQRGLANSAAKLLPWGTIVITARGTVGVIARLGREMTFNQTCYGLIPREDYVSEDFLYYALKATLAEMKSLAYGTVFETITKKSFDSWYIPLPPLPEQRAIARILGTLDDKIELNQRMNETLEAMAQVLFKSWFVDFDPVVVNVLKAANPIPEKFAQRAAHYRENPDALGLPERILRLFPDRFVDSDLGPIPEGWEVDSLSRVATLETTTVFPNRSPDVMWEHYSIPAFDEGKYPKLEQGREIKSGKYRVPMTCVLASKLNPQFPRVWLPNLVHEAVAICSTEFMPFVPHKAEWRSFLYELLRSDFIQQQIRARTTGSTGSRQRVRPKAVAEMPIVVPSEPVLGQFGLVVSPLHGRLLHNQTMIRTLAALRETLLPKLISGELRVPDVEKTLKETT